MINIYVKEGHRRNQREEAFLTSVANALSEAIKRRQAEEVLNARVQQQAIVAELGELEPLPDEKALLLRAGVGWRKGLEGKAIVPADSDSQAGYTLLSSGPVIVDDLRTEDGRKERLQSSEKKLREITSALGEGVYVVDEQGRLIFINPEAERLLGWRETELLNKIKMYTK